MNPEEKRLQCVICQESEPSFIHTVNKDNISRRLCTDCLLKEHRESFCSICLNIFDSFSPPDSGIVCKNCLSVIHHTCNPPSSAASSFKCPTCSDPNFVFFHKSHLPGDEDGERTVLDMESVKALVAAAEISVFSLNEAAKHLKCEADKKIYEATKAKMKAKAALENLQVVVVKEKGSKNVNSRKRKSSDH